MKPSRIFAVGLGLVLAVLAAPAVGASAPAHGTADGLAGASSVRTDDVCFTVHNQGDPVASRVYGVRYYVGVPDEKTKAIILVHGNSVTHAFWDTREDFSVARRLAGAGYLVIAYDRLGYAKSPYIRPRGAGYALTLHSQRVMLHEMVTQVKAGSYTFGRDGTCATGSGPAAGLPSETVMLIGHSAGGAIVSGYPGHYHDVAAMVQAGWSNREFDSPEFPHSYIARTVGVQLAEGNDYANLLPTPADCEMAVLYRPTVVASLVAPFCRGSVPAPAGELAGIGATIVDNLAAIHDVGPHLPVLLAWADPDFFVRPDSRANETMYWSAHCGCDVESWIQPATGHAFVAHESMPTFTTKVVTWLTAKGLGPHQQ